MKVQPITASAAPLRDLSYRQLRSLSDEGLLVQLAVGHDEALAVLFDRFSRLVLNTAFRILHDVGEAEDVAQETIYEFVPHVGTIRPGEGYS